MPSARGLGLSGREVSTLKLLASAREKAVEGGIATRRCMRVPQFAATREKAAGELSVAEEIPAATEFPTAEELSVFPGGCSAARGFRSGSWPASVVRAIAFMQDFAYVS